MKITQYPHEIYEIEDFLSENTVNDILSLVNLDGDDGWGENNTGYKVLGQPIIEKLEQDILHSFNNVSGCISLQDIKRLKVGEVIDLHYDQSKPYIMWGVVVYLNDNYLGGEIEYPDINFKLKPKKYSMIIHKSTLLHHVLPVIEGCRYMITTFIFGDETTQIKL